jgi:hypothetical protein
MSPTKIKVKRLLRLAIDPGASESEARTSAYLAAKIIDKDNLEFCEPGENLPKTKKGKRFRGRRVRSRTLLGLERRMDTVENFIAKTKSNS